MSGPTLDGLAATVEAIQDNLIEKHAATDKALDRMTAAMRESSAAGTKANSDENARLERRVEEKFGPIEADLRIIKEKVNKGFPLKEILAGFLTVVLAVAGGTFAIIAKSAVYADHVDRLEVIAAKEESAREKDREVVDALSGRFATMMADRSARIAKSEAARTPERIQQLEETVTELRVNVAALLARQGVMPPPMTVKARP